MEKSGTIFRRRSGGAAFTGLFLLCLFVLICETGFSAQESGQRSVREHYAFAHRFLPSILHEHPLLGLALASPKKGPELLRMLWEDCRSAYSNLEATSPEGLSVHGMRINDDTILALITMPSPAVSPEAYYVCVITRFQKAEDGSVHATSVGYYTLEKAGNFDEGLGHGDKTPALPTVLGSWDKDLSHLNYGAGPSPDNPDDFISRVLLLYQETSK